LEEVIQAYNEAKKVRRLLRAKARDKSTKDALVLTQPYGEQMLILLDTQLDFEALKTQAQSNLQLFPANSGVETELASIEKYLNKIVDESRILQMDSAGRAEGRGNAAETADFFFHPSGPLRLGYMSQCKSLIYRPKLARGAGRTPFHPGNPGEYETCFPSLVGKPSPELAQLPKLQEFIAKREDGTDFDKCFKDAFHRVVAALQKLVIA
jgi:hypothetical protein